MKGLILAAGKGERLRPLTNVIPKALIPIQDKPLINYPLLALKKAGIKEIGIVIRPQDYSKFKSALKIKGLVLKYIVQKKPQGTASEIKRAAKFLGNKRFLVCWCDFLSPFNLRELINKHLEFKPSATLLINQERDPSGTGQVLIKGRFIKRIAEKPKTNFSFWGSTGALLLEPEIFSVFAKIKPASNGEYHIAAALQYLIDQEKAIRFIKLNTWKINVNTPKDLRRARVKVKHALMHKICEN
jgi:glucose-1-phosphate thymidylyltransferase